MRKINFIAIGTAASYVLDRFSDYYIYADYYAFDYKFNIGALTNRYIKTLHTKPPCEYRNIDSKHWKLPVVPNEIQKLLIKDEFYIIITCLGSYTGTFLGESLFNKLIAKEYNFSAICSIPFRFEGKLRIDKANRVKERFKTYSQFRFFECEDVRENYGNVSLTQAFEVCDVEMCKIINSIIKI